MGIRAPAALLAALLIAWAASACRSPECRAQMDRCLALCPPEDTAPEDARGPHDTRDSCVKRCQAKCEGF